MSDTTLSHAPDLTVRPPRASRAKLGGFALLPRMLDKARATLAGKNGEFHYNCPLDQHFLNFTGIDPEELKKEIATGKGDGEILQWVLAHAKKSITPWEIDAWSDYQLRRTPDSDVETSSYYASAVAKYGPGREDIRTWADLLDLDDYVTFGGKA